MYSKLGGCLEITTKLGPLARTDIWAGFTGLLERLMTNLGLDSSLEEPWDSLLGVEVEMMLFSWEDSGALCLGECLQPCLTDLVGLLNCPAWGELVAWGMLLPLLGGRRAVTWEALFPSPEGRWAIAWEELLPSPKGRWAVAGWELLPLLGGRWAIAGGDLGGMPDAWLFAWEELMAWGILLPSLGGRRAVAWEALLPSWRGRRVIAWEELLPAMPEGRRAAAGRELLPSQGGRWAIARGELGWMPDAWLLAGVELIAWEGLLTSLEGRRAPAWLLVWNMLLPWDMLLPSPGGKH